jgi:hypothetical protein
VDGDVQGEDVHPAGVQHLAGEEADVRERAVEERHPDGF